MERTDVELEFCMNCGKPNPPDRAVCECGGRDFVFGKNFRYENKQVICGCGHTKFQMTFHMNTSPIYTKNYKCGNCGNVIATQTYVENDYM